MIDEGGVTDFSQACLRPDPWRQHWEWVAFCGRAVNKASLWSLAMDAYTFNYNPDGSRQPLFSVSTQAWCSHRWRWRP